MGYNAIILLTFKYLISMTRTDFLHNVAIAFANNCSLAKENFSTEYCTTLICSLAEQLTDKVAEKAGFDPEYQL